MSISFRTVLGLPEQQGDADQLQRHQCKAVSAKSGPRDKIQTTCMYVHLKLL